MMWTTHILLAFIWLSLFVNCDVQTFETDGDKDSVDDMLWYDELFGAGLTEEIIRKESKRHIASSTEDLKILYSDEQLILQTLRSENSPENELYLQEIGNLSCAQNPEYVLHPINAFHLMKRSFQWWPKLLKKFPQKLKNIQVPEKIDFIFGASYGILSIWAFHDLNILDLAKGQIIDPKIKQVYQSCKELSPEDMIIVGHTAKEVWRLNGQVDWLKAALKVAKSQKKPKDFQKSVKKFIQRAEDFHDDYAFNSGFISPKIDGSIVWVNLKFYQELLNDHLIVKKRLEAFEERKNNIVPFVNLLKTDTHSLAYVNLHFDIPYFMNGNERELCKGNDTLSELHPPMHIMHYQCHYLTRNDPFLKLGPFKYEPLNDTPHIALLRDFASVKQVMTVRQQVNSYPALSHLLF